MYEQINNNHCEGSDGGMGSVMGLNFEWNWV